MVSDINRKCCICKKNIALKKQFDNNILFYDDKFYHKECFNKCNQIVKKCKKCGKDIRYPEEQKIVCFEERYYHEHCFDIYCHETKRKSTKRENAYSIKDILINDAKEKLNEIYLSKNKQNIKQLNENALNKIKQIFDESEVNEYIKSFYSINIVNNSIWRKLESVYSGTYKTVGYAIPPDHLLDMWKRKSKLLISSYESNIRKGNDFTVENRILYDLAILVNKYNGYLSWLEKQKVVENQSETEVLKVKNRHIISQQIKDSENNNIIENEEANIIGLVDEIFG